MLLRAVFAVERVRKKFGNRLSRQAFYGTQRQRLLERGFDGDVSYFAIGAVVICIGGGVDAVRSARKIMAAPALEQPLLMSCKNVRY